MWWLITALYLAGAIISARHLVAWMTSDLTYPPDTIDIWMLRAMAPLAGLLWPLVAIGAAMTWGLLKAPPVLDHHTPLVHPE